MNKVAVIVIWFGKLPDYFRLFVRSLTINDEFDFLLFTDQEIVNDNLPANLKVFPYSFTDLRQLAAIKLNMDIELDSPYKLCDFRPAYGEIFSAYLAGYRFWGYCDMDVMFGNLKKFITEDVLSQNRKIFNRGHLTLYQNSDFVNQLYKSSSTTNHKIVFQSKESYIFDEWHGIHQIFKEFNIEQYHKECMADVSANTARYECSNIKNYKYQIFVWENGSVFQYYLVDDNLHRKELAYIHFQKRKIKLQNSDVFTSRSVILNAREFLPFDREITTEDVLQYNPPNYVHYIKRHYSRMLKRVPFYKDSVSINRELIKKPIA